MSTNDKRTDSNESAIKKSKLKQSKLAIVAGSVITFGIIVIIVLMFLQKGEIKEHNVATNLALDGIKGNVEELDTTTDDLRSQLENMLKQLDSMDTVINGNKETVESINAIASQSGNNIVDSKDKIGKLQNILNDYIKKFESETAKTSQDVQNSFNVVYQDIQSMLNTTNNNNSEQNTNYKNLSTQMTKTLNDIDKFIQDLSEENKEQNKLLTEQVEAFKTELTEYLENFNDEINKKLDSSLETITTNLNDVQSNISSTRKEIIDLINELDKKQSEDIQAKYDAILNKMVEITNHFNETLGDISSLISALSEQNDGEYQDIISKLNGMQEDLNTVNNTNHEALLTQFKTFETNVESEITSIESSLATEINNLIESQNGDYDEVIEQIKAYNKNVTDSFTSVSNGKKALSSALLAKYNELGLGKPTGIDGSELAEVAYFADIENAINNITFPAVAGDVFTLPQTANITITAHFCTAEADPIKTFTGTPQEAFDAYRAEVQRTTASLASYSGSSSGCYTNPVPHVHNDSCYGYLPSDQCPNSESYSTETHTDEFDDGGSHTYTDAYCSLCGAAFGRESESWTYGPGVGGGGAQRYYGIRTPHTHVKNGTPLRLLCTKTIEYYSRNCGFSNGQLVGITINY